MSGDGIGRSKADDEPAFGRLAVSRDPAAGHGQSRGGVTLGLLLTAACLSSGTAQSSDRVRLLDDGTLAVRAVEAGPLAGLLREIASTVGADLVVRRDPGMIGPITIEGLPAGEALKRLVGRHALAVRYRDGAVVAIIVVAASTPTDRSPGTVMTGSAPVGALGTASLPSPEVEAANRRAVALRDVIDLSYRHDAAATTLLRRLAADARDTAVRAAAISALAGKRAPGATTAVARGLVDPEPQGRLRAVESLWNLDGARAAYRLRMLAANDPDPMVRAQAERLLQGATKGQRPPASGPRPQWVDR